MSPNSEMSSMPPSPRNTEYDAIPPSDATSAAFDKLYDNWYWLEKSRSGC